MSYTYYFRSKPDLTNPLPPGSESIIVHRKPEYEYRIQCDAFGFVKYSRRLTSDEMAEHKLVSDPANYLAGVMRG